jgi:hypothetical protein
METKYQIPAMVLKNVIIIQLTLKKSSLNTKKLRTFTYSRLYWLIRD